MLFVDLITDWRWPNVRPTVFGWYHIMWIIIMILVVVLLCLIFARKHDSKTDDRVIFFIGTMLLAIEIYKQIFYTLKAGHYQWYIFPFQFCSIPMYVACIAPLIKNVKVKETMYKFLASFGLLAGIAVMIYPGDCFNSWYVTILIHTMLWHASIVIMGVYLIVAKGYGKSIKEVMNASIVFTIILMIAVVANVLAYNLYFKDPTLNIYNDKFYLMYVSPYYETPLPILSNIKEVAPYPIFLLCYILAFVIGTSILWFIIKGIRNLIEAKEKNK
ncbi:MAG: YwaF family protein [Erysipelotrichaceae bacterium]|nr:YwaF family protein [Erysipelotrichaceae bacterium]